MQQALSASAPAKKAARGNLESINIRFAANGGFMVQLSYAPAMTSRGPQWTPDPKPAVFTEPGSMLTYIEQCVGKKEHSAHEKSEKKIGGYERASTENASI